MRGASFGPMAAISRHGQGGRIYNNTRARVLLRRMCVKPAALTTHSPPKTSAPPRSPDVRPRTATRPSRALPRAHAAPMPSPPTSQPIPRRSSPLAPSIFSRPSRALLITHAAPTHARRLRDTFPADRTTHSPPKTLLAPAQRHALPEHSRSSTQPRHTPAGCAMHSSSTAQPIPRSDTLPPLPFRFGHKKTAPHSACAMPNVSVDRRCGRSFGLVSRALFAAVAGRWRVGVGLRPQPWALRSRRCGRVLRA